MKKPKLYIVKNEEKVVRKDSELKQLSLFESVKNEIILVLLDTMNSGAFRNLLDDIKPGMILDTRSYPSFFSLFSSTNSAFREFEKREIEYNVVPLARQKLQAAAWNEFNSFFDLIKTYFSGAVKPPLIIVFSSEEVLYRFSRLIESSSLKSDGNNNEIIEIKEIL